MKRRLLGIVTTFSFLFATSLTFADAENPRQEISAQGTADFTPDNAVKARGDAVDKAMVDALLTGSSEVLTSDIFTQNKDILEELFSAKPKEWVQDYKVVGESKPDKKTLQVLLSVVPNRKKLKEELTRMGILFDRAKRPTFVFFSLKEVSAGKKESTQTASSKAWSKRIASRLQHLGYSVDVIDSLKPDEPRLWDISITGSMSQYQTQAISFEMHGSQIKTKAELGKIQARFNLDDRLDLIAGISAIRLLGQVLPGWYRQTGEGKSYDVTVTGLKSFSVYKELREFFNSGTGGFSSGHESMLSQGTVTFEVVYEGDSTSLAKALRALKLKGAALKVADVRDHSVSLEAK